MQKIVTVENMRKSDAYTIENFVSSQDLMYRAGKAVFDSIDWIEPVAIVCGSGNNAGDGFVIANLLCEHKVQCHIFLLSERFSVDGRFYYDLCRKSGITSTICNEETNFFGYGTIVDCIFGTGFQGDVRGLEKTIIEKINLSKAYIVSVDINSGLNGKNGFGSTCVLSDVTVSIGNYKPGHFLNKAKDMMHSHINCDIGIKLVDKNFWLFEDVDCLQCLSPRSNFSNKGTYGYVALIGGSTRYCGAVKLANLACSAMLSGAGVVKIALPDSIRASVMPYLLESTLFPVSDKNGEMKFVQSEFEELISNVKVVALGMGLGVSEEIKKILNFLIENYKGTLIIDADGLNCLSQMKSNILLNSRSKIILTPHVKEFSRLTRKDSEEILSNPVETAQQFASNNKVILLLKGPTTIITDGEETYFVDRGCPGMATAGSGDVLSGILAGICAYNSDNLLAATATAAYINGVAGELAQSDCNPISMLSSDTVKNIEKVITRLIRSKE